MSVAGEGHHETEKPHGGDHHHGQHHDESTIMPFYTPPKQRQRWGDEQLPVHNNWGDIFFDLFYVALAYNLGNLLREDPTWRGLLYVCACFLPIIGLWHTKMYWDARFYVRDDIFHRLYEVLTLIALATAVLYVRPISVLSNLKDNVDMFAYCTSVMVGYALSLGRMVEIATCERVWRTPGLYEEAFHAVKRDLLWIVAPFSIYTAVAIYTGIQHFGAADEDYSTATADASNSSTYEDDGDHRRALASADEYASKSESDVAAWLCLMGGVSSPLVMIFFLTIGSRFIQPKDSDWTKISVPMNIDYAIHRYGEWTMLLLGESVLSLLIVDLADGFKYYQTFYTAATGVILLEFLHFRSQPHNPDEHALRRKKEAAMLFTNLMYVYSIALVILGTSFKMFLFEFVYESSSGDRRMLSPLLERLLAGSESAALRFDTDDRRQRIAHFFSGSLAIVFLALDGMSLAHKGIDASLNRCQCEGTHTTRKKVLLLIVFRVALIAFFGTLSQYVIEPDVLAFLGFVGIVCQLLTRILGSFLFPPDEEEQEDAALERVANYLSARIR